MSLMGYKKAGTGGIVAIIDTLIRYRKEIEKALLVTPSRYFHLRLPWIHPQKENIEEASSVV